MGRHEHQAEGSVSSGERQRAGVKQKYLASDLTRRGVNVIKAANKQVVSIGNLPMGLLMHKELRCKNSSVLRRTLA